MNPQQEPQVDKALDIASPQSLALVFLDSAIKRLQEYKTLGDKTLAQLSEEELHFQPAGGSNSIAVIIRHLHGNMLSRWTNFLSEDGEKPWRQRDAEFEEGKETKEKLEALWQQGWSVFFETLHSLQPDDLSRSIRIRNEPLPVMDAIIRQIAHYSGHVGQMVYLGKMYRGAEWQSLSIPVGGSDAFNLRIQQDQE